jgi:hypothetical protein
MKTKICLVLIILIVHISFTEDYTVEKKHLNKKADLLHLAAGSGLLALELIGLPLIDVYAIKQKTPKFHSPFNYVSEREPFLEDKLWHFVGASMFTELNYYIFSKLFFMDDPFLLSALTSLTFWTGMECMDALTGSGFSLLDETGDLLGVTFGLLRLYYPNLPIRVRIGVKDWSAFAREFSNVLSGTIHHEIGTQYDYMKVDIVYMFPSDYLYTGVAISRKSGKKNQFGVTAGFDIASWLNSKKKGWWNSPLRFFDNHFSFNFEFTMWMK